MSRTILLDETNESKTVAYMNGDLFSETIVLRSLAKFYTRETEHWETVGEILITRAQLATLLTGLAEGEASPKPAPSAPLEPAPDRKTEALEQIAEHLRIANLLTVAHGGQFGDTRKIREHLIERMGI